MSPMRRTPPDRDRPGRGAATLAAASLALLVLPVLGCGTGPGGGAGSAEDGPVAAVFAGTSGRWIDLTHPFSEDAVYWPTARGFELTEEAYGETEGGYFYSAYSFSAAEHGGTHLDAPIHFARGGTAADEIGLDRLMGPAVVVDVSRAASADPDYRVPASELRAWEERNGPIPAGAIVLLRTGWSERWPDRARYLGTSATGPAAVPELHFPGLDPEAARWLVEERSPGAVGIDTPSIDRGQSSEFMAHRILYGADVPGFENVALGGSLPERGAYVVGLPMKIEGGSGGPLRIVAYVPDGAGAAP